MCDTRAKLLFCLLNLLFFHVLVAVASWAGVSLVSGSGWRVASGEWRVASGEWRVSRAVRGVAVSEGLIISTDSFSCLTALIYTCSTAI